MTSAFITEETLKPFIEKMESYLKKLRIKNEAKKTQLIEDYADATMTFFGWLPWMTKERAMKKAKAKFKTTLRGSMNYHVRDGTIGEADLILQRIKQLISKSDDGTIFISGRHLDFLMHANWKRL